MFMGAGRAGAAVWARAAPGRPAAGRQGAQESEAEGLVSSARQGTGAGMGRAQRGQGEMPEGCGSDHGGVCIRAPGRDENMSGRDEGMGRLPIEGAQTPSWRPASPWVLGGGPCATLSGRSRPWGGLRAARKHERARPAGRAPSSGRLAAARLLEHQLRLQGPRRFHRLEDGDDVRGLQPEAVEGRSPIVWRLVPRHGCRWARHSRLHMDVPCAAPPRSRRLV